MVARFLVISNQKQGLYWHIWVIFYLFRMKKDLTVIWTKFCVCCHSGQVTATKSYRITMAFFGNFCPKMFETNLKFWYQWVKKSGKIKAALLLQLLKLNTINETSHNFFLIFSSLSTKIEICPKYFLDKKFQKQSWWKSSLMYRQDSIE